MRVLNSSEIAFVSGGDVSTPVADVVVTARKKAAAQDLCNFWGMQVPMAVSFEGNYAEISADPLDQIFEDIWNQVKAFLENALEGIGSESATDLSNRDSQSPFNPEGKVDMGNGYYYDPDTKTYWWDRNGNGTPETHFKIINGDAWADKDFNGVFESKLK